MSKRKADHLVQADHEVQKKIEANPLQFLFGNTAVDDFFHKNWEKQAIVLRANEAMQKEFPAWFAWSALKRLVEGSQGDINLEFGIDINAARYKDGKRETLNEDDVDLQTVSTLFDEGCTLQVHQPQRFNDHLAKVISAMETQLGCLVGSNAYLTPKGTQGLAPHYDDVELWVCQTEGSKHWKVYKSKEGYELPFASSKDFDQAEIGEPVIDTVLQVGDVLYLPRGTIHQAVAQEAQSCHVTISTYQRWTVADFTRTLIQELQDGVPESRENKATPILPAEMRVGLPVGFLYETGLQAQSRPTGTDTSIGQNVRKATASALRALANCVESEESWTSLAADRMSVDFLQARMPPGGVSAADKGQPPRISDKVQSVGKNYFRLVPCYPGPEIREAYPDEKEFVMVLSCLKNQQRTHMMGGGGPPAFVSVTEEELDGEESFPKSKRNGKRQSLAEEEDLDSDEGDESDSEENSDEEASGDLVFPASYAKALIQLLEAEEPLPVKDIKLGSKEEKVGLAYSLWDEGVLYTNAKLAVNPTKRIRL